MTRISRVFVFFVVAPRIQAPELRRANNPSEGDAALFQKIKNREFVEETVKIPVLDGTYS